MKKLFFILLLAHIFSFAAFAQEEQHENVADSLVEAIQQRSWYFKNVQGQIQYKNGILELNGVNIDLKKAEIGYQVTDDGIDHMVFFISEDGDEHFEFLSNGDPVFRTSNVLHLVRTADQAIEMVVLLSLLKAVST